MRTTWILSGVGALGLAAVLGIAFGGAGGAEPSGRAPTNSPPQTTTNGSVRKWNMKDKVIKTDDEWKQLLTAEQFKVARKKGTERAFSGIYWNNHEEGVYRCVCCDLDLFSSAHKFESGTGWPSFYQPIVKENVKTEADNTLFARRTEVLCPRCNAHLGHVFEDGPAPTGLRYCMNSAALRFNKKGAP